MPLPRELMDSQSAWLHEAIDDAGFQRADFEDLRSSDRNAEIKHVSGGSYVFANLPRGGFVGVCTPGKEQTQERRTFGNWPSQQEHFRTWLGHLRRELETVDPWRILAAEVLEVGGTGSDTRLDEPFAEHEVKQIAAVFGEIKTRTRELALSDQQYVAIDAKLDELLEVARDPRRPRGQWRSWFIGYFVSYMIEAIIPPEVTGGIIRLGLAGLAQLFGAEPPELPPGGGGGPVEPMR